MDNEPQGTGNSYSFEYRVHDQRIGRWLSVDLLAGKFADWNPYNYALNSPISLLDEDGREPIKPQAGTAKGFVTTINTTGTLWGLKKGNLAHKAMLELGRAEWALDSPRPMPGATGRINSFRDKYIYTEKGGWIDMAHFMFYAGKAYKYKLQKQRAQELIQSDAFRYMREGAQMNLINQAAIDPTGKAVQDGYLQEFSDRFLSKHSAYSYEDLPSDRFGADFGANYFDPNSKLSFGEQLQGYLDNLGATAPEKAPNYHLLPRIDPEKKPSRTNYTTNPVYIKENPCYYEKKHFI